MAVKVFRLDIIPEQAQVLADALSRATESSLSHPSIVEPIASGVEGTVAYRAEEYVAAESLDVAMRHYAPAPIEKALPFITQLAGAIDFARAAGVGHGGLHPRDIFVTPDEARATGFGVVEALEEVGIRAPIRRPYTAPERIEGAAWSTPADVFSLAAIAFELLTARRPAGTGAQAGSLPEGEHSAALHAVLARALADDPARRYASALAFAGALESAARGEMEPEAVAGAAAIAPVILPAAAVSSVPQPVVPAVAERVDLTAPVATTPTLFDEEADEDADEEDDEEADDDHDDVELDAEDLVAEPAVETERFAEEFVEAEEEDFLPDLDEDTASANAAVEAPADDLVLDQAVYAAEDPLFAAADPESDPPAYHEPPERTRSAILPFAVLMVPGLLGAFALGHFIGSRDRRPVSAEPASTTAAQPAPATAPIGPATPEKPGQYSEQKVTAPPPNPVAGTTPRVESSPAPPAVPARIAGHLVVRSSPSRAAVTINGQWRGRTPLTLDALPFGKYVVRVVQDGFNIAREEVTLTPQDASRTIDARLEAKARGRASLRPSAPDPSAAPALPRPAPGQAAAVTGSLYVDSRPRGATVLVDGKAIGQTPLTLPEIAPGTHVVRIEMAGKKVWTSVARVTAGKLERVTGSLEDR